MSEFQDFTETGQGIVKIGLTYRGRALVVIYLFYYMPSKPAKSPVDESKSAPNLKRSVGFGVMLAAWWILSIEIPRWNIFRIMNMRGIQMSLVPMTHYVYGVAELWSDYRWLFAVIVILSIPFHLWLWKRRMNYDLWGKWLFRTGFMVLYIVLYGFFILMLVGAELPVYSNPAREL